MADSFNDLLPLSATRIAAGEYEIKSADGRRLWYMEGRSLAEWVCERINEGWQKIESAPKDGTAILLVWYWNSGIHTGVTVVEARWVCRKHQCSSVRNDCPNSPNCDMGWGHYAGEFSHWMPLPDAPGVERE